MAATSDLLVAMEDIDDIVSNLDVSGTAGANQDRAVRALNSAQDLLEAVIGRYDDLLATVDDTVTQTASQEYSATPSRTMRIDSLWFLDASTGLPRYEIDAERRSGAHMQDRPWPIFDVTSATPGRPEKYWWAQGDERVYWDRLADTTNSIRFVGFFGAADMTIVGSDSTFAYPDSMILPFAQVASEIFWFRRGENWEELRKWALQYFNPVVEQLVRGWKHQKGELRGIFPSW